MGERARDGDKRELDGKRKSKRMRAGQRGRERERERDNGQDELCGLLDGKRFRKMMIKQLKQKQKQIKELKNEDSTPQHSVALKKTNIGRHK